jgi:hypothetical protein
MTNFEKIILTVVGVLFVIVLFFVAIVFRQQKTLNALSGRAAGASKQLAVPASVKKNNPPLTEVIKMFSGTIESISENQLTVNVQLPDFSKPKDPEKVKSAGSEPVNLSSSDFETLDKKITVNISIKTVFDKKTLAELKTGDMVSVTSDKSPYSADTVMAEKITFVGTPK